MADPRVVRLVCVGCMATVPNCFTDGGLIDGGACSDDSQCPSGDYCDFGYGNLRPCAPDGGLGGQPPVVIDSGVCLPAATCTRSPGMAVYCNISEQCLEADTCISWTYSGGMAQGTPCTPTAPCMTGECTNTGCTGPVTSCPAACKIVTVPHMSCDQICACPAAYCAGHDGG